MSLKDSAQRRDVGTTAALGFEEIYYTSRDGLQLYARHYPAPGSLRRPAVCIPGITRNSRDFHSIAVALSTDETRARPVYTIDLRGRGKSDHDTEAANYTVGVELLDVLDFLTSRSLSRVGLIGTSRGGLIAMVMAAVEPTALGAVVLNDIGPAIEIDGLSRIAGYVGKMPQPHSWSDAARLVKDLNARQFPRITDAEWLEIAKQLFNEKEGRPVSGYDPKLAKSLSVLSGPPPTLWPQFEALKGLPVMVLRGENSDLLSTNTVEEMRRRHPRITAHTVRWEGHAPLLRDDHTVDAVAAFLAGAD
ncbi:MAG: alpha/beta hydrolase [Hyphomicrobiaceae bacterium]|nr:alpha/beta hydrolase [Hyphomicrobiaceae bacterium]